jgi:hypothetical protein
LINKIIALESQKKKKKIYPLTDSDQKVNQNPPINQNNILEKIMAFLIKPKIQSFQKALLLDWIINKVFRFKSI